MRNRRITLSGAILALILVIIGAVGLLIQRFFENREIKNLDLEIEARYAAFLEEKEENQYATADAFIKDAERYSAHEEPLQNFEEKVKKIKEYFEEVYETDIQDATLSFSDETTKEDLNGAILKMEEMKKKIKSHKITDTKEYIDQIDDLIKRYKDKINEIEATEKAETKKNKTDNSSDNNVNSNFNTDEMGKTCAVDENGNPIPGTIRYQDKNGNIYDENGKYLGNLSEGTHNR